MLVSVHRYNGMVSLTVSGRLDRNCKDSNPAHQELGDYVAEFTDRDKQAVVFDLSNVTRVDTYGLGQMVYCEQMIMASGGKSCWLVPTNSVTGAKLNGLLQQTQLSKVFRICENIQDAYTQLLDHSE